MAGKIPVEIQIDCFNNKLDAAICKSKVPACGMPASE
jgi:hypothetical protein